jgi:sialic acid synthase SpsE
MLKIEHIKRLRLIYGVEIGKSLGHTMGIQQTIIAVGMDAEVIL